MHALGERRGFIAILYRLEGHAIERYARGREY